MNKLPETIFVKRFEEDDVAWLSAEENIESLAEREATLVGVYRLVELRKIELQVVEKVIQEKVEQ